MNPFSLSGPDFLALWIPLALVAGLVTLLVRRVIAGWGASAGEIRRLADQLHPSEVAYLAGDAGRAVEAAVAGLIHVDLLRVKNGKLHPADRANDPAFTSDGVYRGHVEPDELSATEAYVLEQVRRNDGLSVAALVRGAGQIEAQLARRMARDRLLAPRGLVARVSLYVPGLLWLAMGAGKLAVGLLRDRPVGFLTVLLIAGVFALRTLRLARLSTRGAAVLRALGDRTHGLVATARSAPEQLSRMELALAYALVGAGAYAGWAALMPSQAHAAAAASGGGSCGASGCGSGGGASCGASCGGGCGGCA